MRTQVREIVGLATGDQPDATLESRVIGAIDARAVARRWPQIDRDWPDDILPRPGAAGARTVSVSARLAIGARCAAA
jgi:hypothetical protein